jgi:chemotaxis receptor (MCP) glutamine deamidase CheD
MKEILIVDDSGKMLKSLETAGAKRTDLEAKLIGRKNILIAKDKLKREGILDALQEAPATRVVQI